MAIGTIRVIPLEQAGEKKKNKRKTPRLKMNKPDIKMPEKKTKEMEPKSIKKEPIIPDDIDFTKVEAVDNLNIAIIAENVAIANDFICGIYYNFIEVARIAQLSVHSNDESTLNTVTSIKKFLGRIVDKPNETKISRDETVSINNNFSIAIRPIFNQRLVLNVNFKCLVYDAVQSYTDADLTYIILNQCNKALTQETIKNIESTLSSASINWVITGYESESVSYNSKFAEPPSDTLVEKLIDKLGISLKEDDKVYFSQMYGGIEVENNENGMPVYSVLPTYIEYTPVACCYPLILSIIDIDYKGIKKGLAIKYAAIQSKLIADDLKYNIRRWQK